MENKNCNCNSSDGCFLTVVFATATLFMLWLGLNIGIGIIDILFNKPNQEMEKRNELTQPIYSNDSTQTQANEKNK